MTSRGRESEELSKFLKLSGDALKETNAKLACFVGTSGNKRAGVGGDRRKYVREHINHTVTSAALSASLRNLGGWGLEYPQLLSYLHPRSSKSHFVSAALSTADLGH
jgi:hypothetical protein